MKILLVSILLFLNSIHQSYEKDAEPCIAGNCKIEDNCRCSTTDSPAVNVTVAPQLVVLAFVEAVTDDLYKTRWSVLLGSRKNPDGDYVSATFYVPHEYTDYQRVLDLASVGFEIGVHSITNDVHQKYWRDANETLLQEEFGGQRTIISTFANIPEQYITGVMTPQLQLAGDNSINAFVSSGFTYDNSWPSNAYLFPYTFDYASSQACNTGANCPKESNPGFWEMPIIDIQGFDNDVCATVAACFRTNSTQTKEDISDWLVQHVETQRKNERAPVTLIIESTWFDNVDSSWDGLVDALDRLEAMNDVFLVSQARVLNWIKNPVPLSDFTTDAVLVDAGCSPQTCKLTKVDGTVRYMNACVPCPKNYPWLGNPSGN